MLLKALGNAIKNSVELLARECRGLSAVLIAYQTALKEAHSKGRAPELNPDQIETLKSELIAKLSKVVEKDNTLIIGGGSFLKPLGGAHRGSREKGRCSASQSVQKFGARKRNRGRRLDGLG